MAIHKKSSQGKAAAQKANTRQQGIKGQHILVDELRKTHEGLKESFKAPVKVPQLVDESPSEKILAILRDLEPEKRNDTMRGVINALCLQSLQY